MSNWLTKIFKRSQAQQGRTPIASTVPSSLIVHGGNAMAIATVFRCVQLLSEGVAKLTLHYLRQNKEGVLCDITNSDLHYLLNVRPSSTMNIFDFWKKAVQDMLLTGNAYIVPVYNVVTMSLERLVLCSRGSVAHDIYADTYTINDAINGLCGVYDEADIIHLKNYTLNGKNGISTLASARTVLSIASTGDRETLDRFANGGNVRGIVGNNKSGVLVSGEFQDAELKNLAEDLDGQFREGKRIVSLPSDVEWSPLSLTSTDMQFLESRKFTIREICRFFGVNPVYVFDETGSSNYKDAANRETLYNNGTLDPILSKIEAEFNAKLIPRERYLYEKFEFDRDDIGSCDHSTRLNHAKQLLELGGTVNEVRHYFNLAPVIGGDVPFVSANLKSITEVNPQTISDDEQNI